MQKDSILEITQNFKGHFFSEFIWFFMIVKNEHFVSPVSDKKVHESNNIHERDS